MNLTTTEWATVAMGILALALIVVPWMLASWERRWKAKLAAEEDRCAVCEEYVYPFEEHCCWGRR